MERITWNIQKTRKNEYGSQKKIAGKIYPPPLNIIF